MAPRFLARAPATGILAYYLILGVLLTLLFSVWNVDDLVPTGRVNVPVAAFQPTSEAPEPVTPQFDPAMAVITMIGMVSAFLLVLPVAWVYMVTKAHRAYDQSVPATVFVLPIVIAGIVLIVRDSITLAFSLAGIVAAVRFRNTLKDTKDAVYVFLAIGVGLASGVQALDVAYITSLAFSVVVLGQWKLEMGQATGSAPVTGGGAMSGPSDPNDKPMTGVMVIKAHDAQAAREAAQTFFETASKRWNLLGTADAGDGMSRLEYAVRLKKSVDVSSVAADLVAQSDGSVSSAEYKSLA